MLIGHGDRAEFASEEFLSYVPTMENFVILKKNPEYSPEEKKDAAK